MKTTISVYQILLLFVSIFSLIGSIKVLRGEKSGKNHKPDILSISNYKKSSEIKLKLIDFNENINDNLFVARNFESSGISRVQKTISFFAIFIIGFIYSLSNTLKIGVIYNKYDYEKLSLLKLIFFVPIFLLIHMLSYFLKFITSNSNVSSYSLQIYYPLIHYDYNSIIYTFETRRSFIFLLYYILSFLSYFLLQYPRKSMIKR